MLNQSLVRTPGGAAQLKGRWAATGNRCYLRNRKKVTTHDLHYRCQWDRGHR